MKLRDDLGVPSMMFETETDLVLLGAAADRQNNSKNIRVWEVAGVAHADNLFTGASRCTSLYCRVS